MSKAPLPPGSEQSLTQQLKQYEEELGYLKNESVPDMSSLKGKAYVYKFDNMDNERLHMMEQMKAANNFIYGCKVDKTPQWLCPRAPHRIYGVSSYSVQSSCLTLSIESKSRRKTEKSKNCSLKKTNSWTGRNDLQVYAVQEGKVHSREDGVTLMNT